MPGRTGEAGSDQNREGREDPPPRAPPQPSERSRWVLTVMAGAEADGLDEEATMRRVMEASHG